MDNRKLIDAIYLKARATMDFYSTDDIFKVGIEITDSVKNCGEIDEKSFENKFWIKEHLRGTFKDDFALYSSQEKDDEYIAIFHIIRLFEDDFNAYCSVKFKYENGDLFVINDVKKLDC